MAFVRVRDIEVLAVCLLLCVAVSACGKPSNYDSYKTAASNYVARIPVLSEPEVSKAAVMLCAQDQASVARGLDSLDRPIQGGFAIAEAGLIRKAYCHDTMSFYNLVTAVVAKYGNSAAMHVPT